MWKHLSKNSRTIRPVVMLLLILIAFTLVSVNTVPVRGQSGRSIDLFTQRGGQGANQSSDMFAPQDLVILYAFVSYENSSVANKLVAYQVIGPPNSFQNITASGSASSNQSGVAEFSFRIPWPSEEPEEKVFGQWYVVATVDIADQTVVDTLTFQVGWIVQITKITILNSEGEPEENFTRQSTVVFDLTVEDNARTAQPGTITISVQDSSGYTIINKQLDNLVFQPGFNHLNTSAVIPADANLGQAKVLAAVYTAPVATGGVLYSPAVSTTFTIISEVILAYQVTFAQSGLDSTVVGTVVTVDGVNYGVSSLPISFLWNVGSTHNFSFASALTEDGKQFLWNSTSGLSTLQKGVITVTASGTIRGNYAVYAVQTARLTIPFWVILAFLFGAGILGAIVLLFFLEIWRRRRKKRLTRPRSYAVIVHPHI
jgi:hypothetical protein